MGIQIGAIMIPYYGLFIVMGLLAAVTAGYIQTRIFHLDFNDFLSLAGAVGLGAMIGAKGLYILVSLPHIDFSALSDPAYAAGLMNGGFVFYGGVAGGFCGAAACGKIFKYDVMPYIRVGIPVIPLAHAFGRMGCYAVGCCYGIPYSGKFAVVYTESPVAPDNVPLFPVQAVEAGCELCLAAVLFLYVYKRRKGKLRSVELYLMSYSVIRFFLEFLRYDAAERGIILGLSTSQWISIVIFAGVIGYLLNGKRGKYCGKEWNREEK